MKYSKKLTSVLLVMLMLLTIATPMCFAYSAEKQGVTKICDDPTLRTDVAFNTSTLEDGRVWTNKAVTTDGDFSSDITLSSLVSFDTAYDEFGVGLSALAQGFPKNEHNEEKVNVVFTIDTSTSMTSNTMDDGKTRLQTLQSVASGFIDELATLGDTYDVHLAIVAYAGIGQVKQKWVDINSVNKAASKTVISNLGKINGDGGNTNTEAGAYLTRLLFEPSYSQYYNTPSNLSDDNTNNFIIFMTDGAPNRYYTNSTSEIGTIPLSSDKIYTLDSGVSRTITNTDYKKMAAKKLLDQTTAMTSIPNITGFSLGLGEWFVDTSEASNFPTATYLCQLMAASSNDIRNPVDNEPVTGDYCWDHFLGYDVPDGAMQGSNPAFPNMYLTQNNYKKGTSYQVVAKNASNGNSTYTYATFPLLMAAMNSTDARYHIPVNGRTEDCAHTNLDQCGIPNVNPELLSQVPFYYAGNTAEKFEQSVKDIATVISNSFNSIVTDVSTTDNPDLDGYVRFYDILGEGMELRKFECVEIDGQRIDGSAFAKFCVDSTEGARRQLITDYYNYFNIMFNTEVTVDTLYYMFLGAYYAGDLFFNSADDFGCCIKWYSKCNDYLHESEFLESYYAPDGSVNPVPADATEIVTQYFMYGEVISKGLPEGHAKTTYLFIADAEDIQTGKHTVQFRVPSSLIPVRTILTSGNEATLQYGSMWPITLFYKVGLSKDNTEELMQRHSYIDDETGNTCFKFYSNSWETAAQIAIDHGDATHATYVASHNNPYYHSVQGQTMLYVSDGNGGYIPADENSTGPYYFHNAWTDLTGTYEDYQPVLDYYASDTYELIADENTGVNHKYLAHNIIRRDDEIEQTKPKTENITETNENYYASTFSEYFSSEHDETYTHVQASTYLGNNGVITFEKNNLTVDDVVVADYGLDISLNVLDNDNFEEGTAIVTNVAPYTAKLNTSQVYVYDPIGKETGTAQTESGIMSVSDDGTQLIFDITSSDFHAENKVYYSCVFFEDDFEYYCIGVATVIPATNIYYEQDFCNFNGAWTTEGTTEGGMQDGTGTCIYGYDPLYTEVVDYSNGSSAKATVTKEQYTDALTNGASWPSATFTFYGTAFDLISFTGPDTGLISVTITNLDTGKIVKKQSVNTNYQGRVEGNEANLFQIPVIYYNIGTYGHYQLTIQAAYHPFFDLSGNDQYDVFLDAIRVYNPAGVDLKSGEVYDAYVADGELNPTYNMLRDHLVKADDGAFSLLSGANGLMYVEKTHKNDGSEEFEGGEGLFSFSTYNKNGPNHEIYLKFSNAVAFCLDNFDPTTQKVHISVKSPTKSAAILSVNGNSLDRVSGPASMYYDITDSILPGGIVVISNYGAGILALCNIKVSVQPISQVEQLASPNMMANSDALNAAQQILSSSACQAPELTQTINFPVTLNVDNGESVTVYSETLAVDTKDFKYSLDDNNNWVVTLKTDEYGDELINAVKELYPDAVNIQSGELTLNLSAVYETEWTAQGAEVSFKVTLPADEEMTVADETTDTGNDEKNETSQPAHTPTFITEFFERIRLIFERLLNFFG